jgi:hypothetical protein
MTKCTDVLALLQTIEAGSDARAGSEVVRELVTKGFLGPAAAKGAGTELSDLRQGLAQLGSEREGLLSSLAGIEVRHAGTPPAKIYGQDPEYRAQSDRLTAIENEERTMRTRFIELLHVSAEAGSWACVNGDRMGMTYTGRELLGELAERQERAQAMELGEFLSLMDAVKRFFAELAARARKVLEIISPAFRGVEEIHLRSAAVGLSVRPGSPEEAAGLFVQAYSAIANNLNLQDPSGVVVAENLAIRARERSEIAGRIDTFQAMLSRPVGGNIPQDELMRALAIILSSEGDAEWLFGRTWELAAQYCPDRPSAAAFLAATGVGGTNVVPYFLQFWRWIADGGMDLASGPATAAVLACAATPQGVTWGRFVQVYGSLSRFNGGGMEVPSAMIALLPSGVEEGLDNVRLASAAVAQGRLSMGGPENLSLGIKLLVLSSAMASLGVPTAGPKTAVESGRPPPMAASAPPLLAMAGVAGMSAVSLGAGMSTFHESSVHRIAWRAHRFHPVHHHYIHG